MKETSPGFGRRGVERRDEPLDAALHQLVGAAGTSRIVFDELPEAEPCVDCPDVMYVADQVYETALPNCIDSVTYCGDISPLFHVNAFCGCATPATVGLTRTCTLVNVAVFQLIADGSICNVK